MLGYLLTDGVIPDEEVYQWIEHCNTFFVFGTHHYGEDTGNSACTYKEVKVRALALLYRIVLPY